VYQYACCIAKSNLTKEVSVKVFQSQDKDQPEQYRLNAVLLTAWLASYFAAPNWYE
jgi:hypothetical protein